jgi:translocator protein
MQDRRGERTGGTPPAKSWAPIALFVAWGIATAGIGGGVTEIGPWYRGLKKPWFQPPDWLFGPAWTTIFILSGLAGVYAWRATRTPAHRAALLAVFAANGILNVTWSLLFFKLHRPDWALLEVGFLWLSIVAMILILRRHSTAAGWLVVPYLAWVTFASILNFAIVQLNAPF